LVGVVELVLIEDFVDDEKLLFELEAREVLMK
jgi:hypothetical protein